MAYNFSYMSKIVKQFISFAITIIFMYLFLKLSIFYLPFLISFILAVMIEPIIHLVMRKLRWTRKSSSIFVLLISIIIIVSIVVLGVTTIFNEANFLLDSIDKFFYKIKGLLNNTLNNDYIISKIPEELRSIIETSEADYLSSISNIFIGLLNNFKHWISKLPNLFTTSFFSIIALYFMCTDKIYMIDQVEHHLPDNWSKKIINHIREINKKLVNYLKAELTLIIISFFISFIGLMIFKTIGFNVKYPLMSALAIGFVDALPILGSGTAMIPWAVLASIEGDFVLGISILALWVFMTIIRNVLEPKLISRNIGIHPVFTIIAMFTGYKLIGVGGMILGPIVLIILKEIYSPIIDKEIFK